MTALARLATAPATMIGPLHLTGTVPLDELPQGAKFDNRTTWDNTAPQFDNRPTWDNWNNKR